MQHEEEFYQRPVRGVKRNAGSGLLGRSTRHKRFKAGSGRGKRVKNRERLGGGVNFRSQVDR